jgi:hypothetical protein
MGLFRRTPPDPLTAAAIADARAAETRADIERARLLAELKREQQTADREAVRMAAIQAEEDNLRQRAEVAAQKAARRVRRSELLAAARPVAPLLVVNGVAVGGQIAYAYADVAPADWLPLARLGLAVGFAAAVESISLYVGWHAHDALLAKAYATATQLRRASYLIAAVVAAINYSHFAGRALAPTPAAVAFGLLSLLSPWLWGLHTRRAQHVQLVRQDLVDETGAVFDPARRRAFPFRSWAARRWSIDQGVRDPRQAWTGYNAERRRRAAERRRQAAQQPAGRIRAVTTVLRGKPLPAGPVLDGEVTDDVQELCDLVRAQARDARRTLTIGAHGFYRLAATPPSVAIAPAVGDGLDALVLATQEATELATPVATRPMATGVASRAVTVAIPDGQPTEPVGHDGAARRVASRTAAKVAKLAAKMPNATDKEIAAKAGVSVSTVRRARGKKN